MTITDLFKKNLTHMFCCFQQFVKLGFFFPRNIFEYTVEIFNLKKKHVNKKKEENLRIDDSVNIFYG